MEPAAPGAAGRPGWRYYAILAAAMISTLAGHTVIEAQIEQRILRDATEEVEHALGHETTHIVDTLHDHMTRYETLSAIGDFVTVAIMSGETRTHEQGLERLRVIVGQPGNDVIQVGGIDSHGISLWSTEPSLAPGLDMSDREHYRAIAIDGRDSIFGRPVIGRATGRLTVQYAHATRDKGALLGVTVVSIDPHGLVDSLGASKSSTLLRKMGHAVLRTDGTLLGASSAPVPGANLRLDQIAAGASVIANVTEEGGRAFLVAAARARVGDLVVLASMPSAEITVLAEQSIRRAKLVGYLATATLLGAIALLGLLWRSHQRAQLARLQAVLSAEGFARLRELAENIREVVIVWRVSPDGARVFEYVSPQSSRELGIPAGELLGNPKLLQPHRDDAAKMRARMRGLLHGDPSGGLEYRIVLPDETVRWIDITSRPIGSVIEDGVVIRRFITCLHNVTEYRILQDRLRETTHRLEELTTESPCVLYQLEAAMVDGQFRITSVPYVSRSIVRQSGYTAEQLAEIGAMARMLPGDAFVARNEMLARAMREDEATLDYPMRRADGRLIWVRDMVRVSERRVGSCILTGFAIDITREKEFSDFLDEASKLASLGEMAAGIAHELHQPLAAISLNVELIGLELPDEPPRTARIRERLEKIMALVDRSANVIRHIREFSRSEMSDAAPVDVYNALEAVAEIMVERLRHNGCSLRIGDQLGGADGTPRVMGHAGPFEQVLINLIANSIDAYGSHPASGDVTQFIDIAVHADGDEIELTVADRAGGIPDSVMPRIFEPFFTTKDVSKGTGLGLSICRRIVNEMGGTIDAVNRDGGAVFTVRLPRAMPGEGGEGPPV